MFNEHVDNVEHCSCLSVSTESSVGADELDLPPTCGLMILKIIIVNILLSLGDQISDFLQVSFPSISWSRDDDFRKVKGKIEFCCSGIQPSLPHLDI